MIFLRFKEWQEQEIDFLAGENPKIECPTCQGEGIIYDDCDCCGHEREDDCEDCNASGRIRFNDINEYARPSIVTKEKYLEAIRRDFGKYARFTAKDEAELYFDSGFIPWCSVYNKKIFIGMSEE